MTDRLAKRISNFFFILLLPPLSSLLCTSCRSYPPPTPLDQLTTQQTRGHQVYEQRCALCHYDRRDDALHGPSLLSVYQKPYLHSGAPANDARVTATILHGHGLMPAQADISAEDLNDLLAYLHTL